MMSLLHKSGARCSTQATFFIEELAELLDVLFMLSAAPVVWEGNSGLWLRDLVVEFSRWILGPRVLLTVSITAPLRWGGNEFP